MITGLHVCKPTNVPQVGQIKTFLVTGDRIKSKGADQGGIPYTITKVEQSATYKDSYGNIGFNLEIEPTSGSTPQPPQQMQPQGRTGAGNGHSDDRSNRIERQHSQEMAMRYFDLCSHFTGAKLPTTQQIRDMISWFQRDISTSPEKPQPQAQPNDDDEEEIPF